MKTTTLTMENLEIHSLASLNPMPSPEQSQALKDSLETFGQTTPIIVVKEGSKLMVLDGRNRINALVELGEKEIKANIHEKLTQTEKKSIVETSETRRHDSVTQLAIKAYYDLQDPDSDIKLQAEAARKHGASVRNIQYVAKVAGTKKGQFQRPDIITNLFIGGRFPLEHTSTDSLTTIVNWLTVNSSVPGIRPIGLVDPKTIELSEEEKVHIDEIIAHAKGRSRPFQEALNQRTYILVQEGE